jgi:hypothetical protein
LIGKEKTSMRLLTLLALTAGLFIPSSMPAAGQVKFSPGIARTDALGGQKGGDLRVGLEPPFMPVGFFAGVDYYLADCSEDCSLWGYRIGGLIRRGTPMFRPYLSGAWVVRKLDVGGQDSDRDGPAVGVGLSVGVGFTVYGEVTREFLGGPLNAWVLRIGLGL